MDANGLRALTGMTDRKVIACNYTRLRPRVAAAGALAYVVPQFGGNLPERVRLVVRSRSGRWVEKWEDIRRLGNFRLKTLVAGHPRYCDERLWPGAVVCQEDVEHLRQAKTEMSDPP